MRNIAIVTSARADWGLLSEIARELDRRKDVELTVIATNMHLDPRFGDTIKEIIASGVSNVLRVPMPISSDSPVDIAKATAQCLEGMADAFNVVKPDLLVILGDRYEMLAVATAATILRIPIAHIHGGEISEGAIDDNIRHALTKLSSLHLTSTEAYRQRVISMGEHPDRVINAGSIGVYNTLNITLFPRELLEESIGMSLDTKTLLVTLHPATKDTVDTEERINALLEALDLFPDSKVLFTYPNNDACGEVIIERINQYGEKHPDRVKVVPSLGLRRYLSAIRSVGAVVGNSSSGIIEVPSAHVPTVNIGIRQRGRIAADSVIHVADDVNSIADGITRALSPDGKLAAIKSVNPYYKPDTLRIIVEALAAYPLQPLRDKTFYDR